ncbi:MAG: PP2C family protein-serine/threonine phosphatase [Gammaproteobacteria bacterium]
MNDGAEMLFLAAEDAPAEGVIRAAGGAAAVWAAPRPGGGRSEDALLALPLGADSAVLAVADGIGGVPGGSAAATRAIRALAAALEEGFAAGQSLQSAILEGIGRANDSVLSMGTGAATTLAVAELAGGRVRAYNVGDSEVMVFGQRGRLKLQTLSHSPVGFAVQAGLVNREEALHHEDRHVVSNFVGSRDMRIEVGSALRLAAMDTVVVCSDGLVDNLRLAEISAIMRSGPLDQRLGQLAESALRRMTTPSGAATPEHPSKPDDLSIIAFRLHPGRAVLRRLPPPRQMPLGDTPGAPEWSHA